LRVLVEKVRETRNDSGAKERSGGITEKGGVGGGNGGNCGARFGNTGTLGYHEEELEDNKVRRLFCSGGREGGGTWKETQHG